MAMKKKRPQRKASPSRRTLGIGKRPGAGRPRVQAAAEQRTFLQYKVVELSTVDEGSLERTVNEWSARGWSLEGVQFAMRESSKRPAMAFVFFTREGEAAEHDTEGARARLRQMSETGSPTAMLLQAPDFTGRAATARVGAVSAHERLAQLAGLDEPEPPQRGLILEPDE